MSLHAAVGYPEETFPEYEENIEKHDKYRFDMMALEEPIKQPTAEALAERMEQEEEEVMARKLSIVKEEDEEEEEGEEAGDEDEEVIEEDTEEEEEEEEEAEAERRQLLSPTPSLPTGIGPEERLGLELSKELQIHTAGKKQITFSEHKDVFRYPKEDANEEEEKGEEEEEAEREDEAGEESEGTDLEEEEEEEGEEAEDEDDPVMEAESLQFGCEASSNPEEEVEEEKEEYLLMSVPEDDEGHMQADVPTEVRVSGLRMRTRRET